MKIVEMSGFSPDQNLSIMFRNEEGVISMDTDRTWCVIHEEHKPGSHLLTFFCPGEVNRDGRATRWTFLSEELRQFAENLLLILDGSSFDG